jgi:hypothetical protein
LKTVKLILDRKAPIRPPLKVLIDGVPQNDIVSIGWRTKWGDVNRLTMEIDARLEIEYVDEEEYTQAQKVLAETKGTEASD